MLKHKKMITGVLGAMLLGAIVFLPQLAEAHPRCHRGYGWSHHHCVRIHPHHPRAHH